ncbi:hypothetical protein CCR75_001270 [Bremia lactucae]|uniref:Uncharacterized protein n=1 Tax=Bremia lactucae TaxID=4779 RepID=A0A976IHR8_BRELC|nr:hypothetical protein CCR75_001270 [Bremia lactucae]
MGSETSNVDKCEIVTVVMTKSETVADPVGCTTTLPRKAKKSKEKAKAIVATQELSEADRLGSISVDHPYLSVLYKRIRSHRKKLEKIKSLEQAQLQEGKVLNAQQLDLMSNKATLEKLVAELEMLREQFIGVFSEELDLKKQLETKDAIVADVTQSEEDQHVIEKINVAAESEKETQELQEEVASAVKETDYTDVYELLKTLHVVNLHQVLNKEVPMVLDFFSKVLLGKTRPPAELSYDENLMESLEEAKKYLMKSDKTFACDTTYCELKAFVDKFASMSSSEKKTEEGNDIGEERMVTCNTVEIKKEKPGVEEVVAVPEVPAEINMMPQISFFTESQLEIERGGEPIRVSASQLEEAVELQIEPVKIDQSNNLVISEIGEEDNSALLTAEVASASQLSFAAVAAGEAGDCATSVSALSGAEKYESGKSALKNGRRRAQNRWREKGSSSSGNKSSGSPNPGGKPRRSRTPRASDDYSSVQGGKWKDDRRSHVDRALRKQGRSMQQPAIPLLAAPHA